MKILRTTALFVLTASLIAACAGRAAYEPSFAPGAAPAFEESLAVDQGFANADLASGAPAEFASTAPSPDRLVIRNADLTVVVADPASSVDEIAALAEEMGGFVVNSNLYQSTYGDGVRAMQASITIRVPAERLNEVLQRIKGEAIEVRSESISGQDVTQEYTDLQSQLRNLEAAEKELREIMASLTNAEDVLNVYQSLRQVRQEIEVTKGRIQYFEQSSKLSAVSVELLPDVVSQPLQIGRWQPQGTAKEALQTLIRALQWFANLAIWVVIFLLPIGLVIGLPIWLVIRAARRRRARKRAEASKE